MRLHYFTVFTMSNLAGYGLVSGPCAPGRCSTRMLHQLQQQQVVPPHQRPIPGQHNGFHQGFQLHGRRKLQCCEASVRERKNFTDMEEAREYLHRQGSSSPGPIAGLLNWLSSNAFGAGQDGFSFGSIYRRWLQFQSQRDLQHSRKRGVSAGAAAAAAYPEFVSSLAVVMFMSEHRVQEMVDKYPQVVDMPADTVAQRMLLLKRLLPNSDVARMIELQPRLLLSCEVAYLTDVVKPRLEVLAAGLPGADIAFMVQEDPRLLFEELETSLPRLHELWPKSHLDVHAFAASDPAELALALRALSDQGPPRKY